MPDPSIPAYDSADPSAYVDAMLALVGDRDPVTLLEAAPDQIRAASDGLSPDDARRPEREGKWSVLQIARHLADSEIVYGYRLRLIVAADRPAVPGYDQDAWADRLHYHAVPLAETIDDYAAMRRMTVRWLRALDDEQWERVGVHSERGEESVRRIVTLLAAHDLAHERQIRRVRETLGV